MNAIVRSSSSTIVDGSSPATILQKMQSGSAIGAKATHRPARRRAASAIASSGVATSPAKRASSIAASSRPSCGPSSSCERAREDVAAHERLAAPLRAPRERRRQHLARELEVAGDRLVRLAPARREAVGDRQQRDVDLDRRARHEVAVQRAPRQRPLVDEEAEAQVMAHERRDVRLQPLARAQPREDLARELPRPRGRGRGTSASRRRGGRASPAWRRRAAARRGAARGRGRGRRRAARRAARGPRRRARRRSTAPGSACSAIVCSSTSIVWAWTSAWW